MEIWKVDPRDPHYGTDPEVFVEAMIDIKFSILLCATRDIYPKANDDSVRWHMIAWHIAKHFERKGVPIPLVADGQQLDRDGCHEFYREMRKKKDPVIGAWRELRRKEANIEAMVRELGLEKARDQEEAESTGI